MSSSYHQHEPSGDPAYSATPWNGVYSSTKAALHLMTDALALECSFLNKDIKVILVAPGAVKSNIANNASYEMPSDSLFKKYIQIVHGRIAASQGANSKTAEEFSQEVVSQVLKPNPPAYMTLGGFSTAFAIAHWMPRYLVRWAMWKVWNKPNQ